MPSTWTVAAEPRLKKEVETKYGPMNVWEITLGDGTRAVDAEMMMKPQSQPPANGETVEGDIEQTPYGVKFKKAQKAGGFNGGGGRTEDPRRQAEIRRMAAARAAIELLAVEVAAGLRFEDVKASDLLLPRIKFFEDDARKAGESA